MKKILFVLTAIVALVLVGAPSANALTIPQNHALAQISHTCVNAVGTSTGYHGVICNDIYSSNSKTSFPTSDISQIGGSSEFFCANGNTIVACKGMTGRSQTWFSDIGNGSVYSETCGSYGGPKCVAQRYYTTTQLKNFNGKACRYVEVMSDPVSFVLPNNVTVSSTNYYSLPQICTP